ncbi:MAG: DinB family protein [SAR202 cluster bacterium]|jgi:hypothetical protein|nr:DinB family protein [SAR202 cluster bacterium]MDP6513619.1 DinB family protein [SAR202 cluster bacterium]MDP6716491.1 DinB family protein [SAR202 cluster bacterium]
MDVKEFFLERHDNLYSSNLNGLLGPLTQEQIRLRPHEAVNSIAWLLWHITRCADVGMNIFVASRPQLLDENWLKQLNVSLHDIGTGMNDDDVSDFSQRVDVDALRAYHAAVGQRTREIVVDLTSEDLDEVTDPDEVHGLIIQEGLLRENAMWVENNFSGKPKAWFLAQLGIAHNYGHMYEANTVRSLMGIRGR